MPRTNFHQNSYGWNYFFETTNDGKKIRAGRYHTNGHINSSEERGEWQEINEANGICVPKSEGGVQQLFHNEAITY